MWVEGPVLKPPKNDIRLYISQPSQPMGDTAATDNHKVLPLYIYIQLLHSCYMLLQVISCRPYLSTIFNYNIIDDVYIYMNAVQYK